MTLLAITRSHHHHHPNVSPPSVLLQRPVLVSFMQASSVSRSNCSSSLKETNKMATSNRSPELRKDPITNRWVLFSPARSKRPTDFKSKSPPISDEGGGGGGACPFCIGHEHECAPEIFRVPGDPNWKIRVIENLYPALSKHAGCSSLNSDGEMGGLLQVVPGFGFHDVVIEAPLHSVQLSDLDSRGIGDVIIAYKRRIEQVAEFDSIKYVQVFKNHGASAGASLSHSHSQIISLPVVPPNVASRLSSMKEYFSKTGKCGVCEIRSKDILIDETTHFISVVPFAASYPFEIWIIPRNHSPQFHELDNDMAADLGGMLRLMLRKMSVQLNNPPYNFMIHTAPLKSSELDLPYTHWFLQIVPQLATVGGFELGSGCYINPVFPEDAASVLREVTLPE